MRDFQTTNVDCPAYVQEEFSESRNYVDLWFHRTAPLEKDLSPTDKELLNYNLIFITLAKCIYSVRKTSLLDEQWLYNSFNTSLMVGSPASTLSLDFYYQDCIPGNFVEPYDPRCRDWYKLALNNNGLQFEKPYVYAFGNTIGMTASDKILDDGGNMLSIVSIDFGLTNLVDQVFAQQDENDESSIYEAYSVFFHEDNRTVFSHRYWNRTSGDLFNWRDLEYNQTSDYPENQANEFSNNLTLAVIDSRKNYDFNNFEEIIDSQLFMNFYKGTKEYRFKVEVDNLISFNQNLLSNVTSYLSFFGIIIKSTALIYPVEAFQVDDQNQLVKEKVMFVARVQRNIIQILLEDTLQFNTLMIALIIVEIVLVSSIVILSLLYFTALLISQIAIPIDQLIFFLKHSNLLIQTQKNKQINNEFREQQNNQNNNVNQSLIQTTNQRFQTQHSYTYQKKESFFSTNGLIQNEFIKNKLAITSTRDIKDKQTMRSPQPSQYLMTNRGLDSKPDYQLISYPTKIYELTDRVTSPTRKVSNLTGRIRKKVETPTTAALNNTKNKLSFQEQSKKVIEQYNIMQKGDISKVHSSFVEISIIKKTFKILAKIIQFERDGLFHADKTQSLLKFSHAYQIFSKIQNQQGIALCHFHLGQLHAENRSYENAFESFQFSLLVSLQELGYSDLNQFQESLIHGNCKQDEFFLSHIKHLTHKYGLMLMQKIQDNLIANLPNPHSKDNLKQQEINQFNDYNKYLSNDEIRATKNEDPSSIFSQVYFEDIRLIDDNIEDNKILAQSSIQLLKIYQLLERKLSITNKFELLLLEADLAELFIYLGKFKESLQKIELISSEISNSTNINWNQFEEEDMVKLKKETSLMDSSNIHILEIRLLFLQGMLRMKQRHYLSAAEHFTQMVENSVFYEPQKKLIALSMLYEIFKTHCLSTKQIEKLLIKEKHSYNQNLLQYSMDYKCEGIANTLDINQIGEFSVDQVYYDVIIMLQTTSFESGMQKEIMNYQILFLDWLYRYFLQPKKDQISVLNYYPQEESNFEDYIDVIQSLQSVESEKMLKLTISQIIKVNKEYQINQLVHQGKESANEPDYFNFAQIYEQSIRKEDNVTQKVSQWYLPLLRCLESLLKQEQLTDIKLSCSQSEKEPQLQSQQQGRQQLIIMFSQLPTQNSTTQSLNNLQKILQKQRFSTNKKLPKIVIINPNDLLNLQPNDMNEDQYRDIVTGLHFESETRSGGSNNPTKNMQNLDILSHDLNSNSKENHYKFHYFTSSSQCKMYLLQKRTHYNQQSFTS